MLYNEQEAHVLPERGTGTAVSRANRLRPYYMMYNILLMSTTMICYIFSDCKNLVQEMVHNQMDDMSWSHGKLQGISPTVCIIRYQALQQTCKLPHIGIRALQSPHRLANCSRRTKVIYREYNKMSKARM